MGLLISAFSLFERLGEKFQLDKWNLAMKKAGETPVKNEEAYKQFQDHMDSAQVPSRSVIRELLKNKDEIGALYGFNRKIGVTRNLG